MGSVFTAEGISYELSLNYISPLPKSQKLHFTPAKISKTAYDSFQEQVR